MSGSLRKRLAPGYPAQLNPVHPEGNPHPCGLIKGIHLQPERKQRFQFGRWDRPVGEQKVAPAAKLESLLPSGLQVDTFDQSAWVRGVSPFWMDRVQLRGIPRIPGASRFPELNLRTYVRERNTNRAGVCFCLDKSKQEVLIRQPEIRDNEHPNRDGKGKIARRQRGPKHRPAVADDRQGIVAATSMMPHAITRKTRLSDRSCHHGRWPRPCFPPARAL